MLKLLCNMNSFGRLWRTGYLNYSICRCHLTTTPLYFTCCGIARNTVKTINLRLTSQYYEKLYFPRLLQCNKLCTSSDKESDTFGTFGDKDYELFEMDENEVEEERKTGERIPRHKYKFIRQQYQTQIRHFVKHKDMRSALECFIEMKKKGIHLRADTYSSLSYGFATQGNLSMCLKLYNEMKKRAIKPTQGIYTSIISAVGESARLSNCNKDDALLHINKVRQIIHENNVALNSTHYHAMIKTYSYCGKIFQAFQVADEMKDKGIALTYLTYTTLLYTSSRDKKNGLRLALGLWHQMRKDGIIPDTKAYEAFLLCIREANLGRLQVNECLIPGRSNATITVSTNVTVPDLLASPPVINPFVLSTIQNAAQKKGEPTQPVIKENTKTQFADDILNEIIIQNRLILFGGALNILKRMKEDGATPTAITLTLLLQLSVPSMTAENELITYANENHIKLDVQFFNVLIERRVNRNDFEIAKSVLSYMELHDLYPDIVTFGLLSKGCQTKKDYEDFISGMHTMGSMPNYVIITGFLFKALYKNDIYSVEMLLKYIIDARMRIPSTTRVKLNNHIDLLKRKTIMGTKSTPETERKQQLRVKKLQNLQEAFKMKTRDNDIITTDLVNEAFDSRRSLRVKNSLNSPVGCAPQVSNATKSST